VCQNDICTGKTKAIVLNGLCCFTSMCHAKQHEQIEEG
jgi:hypothetical protein